MTHLLDNITIPTLVCLLFISIACMAYGIKQPTSGVRVIDGDTVHIGTVKYRLAGIDAPEKKQPYGPEATRYLSRLCRRGVGLIDVKCTDKYGRKVARIYDKNHNCINNKMLSAGMAWAYMGKPSDTVLMEKAKAKRLGLWSQFNPESPSDFRKRMKKPKPVWITLLKRWGTF
jgi:micrococcal nuclease